MLDLEVPCAWDNEQHNVERNQLRLQLHLNIAACALKLEPFKQCAGGLSRTLSRAHAWTCWLGEADSWSAAALRRYPDLNTPKTHWDPHLDAINHCTRVLNVEPRNVKALYRRAQVHLLIPPERHINGLALACADLGLALEIDPKEASVPRAGALTGVARRS
jgi:hypothetical protein